jgi:hypothetical protein
MPSRSPATTLSLLAFLASALVGCSSTEKRSYEIVITNETDRDCLIWLTKDGPPFEPGWKAPEELAIEKPRETGEMLGGAVIKAGERLGTDPVAGTFAPNTRAILRVYNGTPKFNELLAIGPDSPDRRQIPLAPGLNTLVIQKEAAGIRVERGRGK